MEKATPDDLAMSHNPLPPVSIRFNPTTKIGSLKWVVNSPANQKRDPLERSNDHSHLGAQTSGSTPQRVRSCGHGQRSDPPAASQKQKQNDGCLPPTKNKTMGLSLENVPIHRFVFVGGKGGSDLWPSPHSSCGILCPETMGSRLERTSSGPAFFNSAPATALRRSCAVPWARDPKRLGSLMDSIQKMCC